MATPKLFINYPIEYTHLLRRAMNKPVRVPFPNQLEAIRFRNHLYAFRKSIRDSVEGEGVPDDLVIVAPLLSFKIEEDTLLIHHPKWASHIRKALEAVND